MTRTGTPTDAEPTLELTGSAGPAASAVPSGSTSAARRPYRKPQLRALGSVRDLTFGSPVAGLNDFMGGRVKTM